MKSLQVSLIAIALATTAAQAQDASQWAGLYGGLTYSNGSGYQLYDVGPDYPLEGNGAGAMIGYNHSVGAWVYGGELVYNSAEIYELDPANTNFTFTSIVDLKARAGYAMNNVLFYGTVGATLTQWQEGAGNGGFDGSGMLLGLGVDYLVTPNFFVGAEYVTRDVTSDWELFDNSQSGTFEADVDTVTLRVGMKF